MLPCYLDEHASERLTEALERLGDDATSANRLGHKGLSDAIHLRLAAESNRVLITYDTHDFTLLHEAWHDWTRAWGVVASHAGILLIHSSPRLEIGEVAAAIHQFGGEHDTIVSRLFAWKRTTGWREIR